MKEAKKEALRWFLQSEDDFRFVEWVKEESVFYDKGCFIAQQSGEKALKACLYARGERYVLGHSLFEMVGRLCQTESEFKTISDEAKRLDRFYIPTRYPNGLPGGSPFQFFTVADLADAFDDLKKILDICRSYLEGLQVLYQPTRPGDRI
ncbi:MAG: HEPN domain-containing protein [Desulfoferrobacter sp.]